MMSTRALGLGHSLRKAAFGPSAGMCLAENRRGVVLNCWLVRNQVMLRNIVGKR